MPRLTIDLIIFPEACIKEYVGQRYNKYWRR